MPIDYESLRIIWWGLLGVLLVGFAIMDGFDLGVAALLPWLGHTDIERRIIINTVGPVWEGNQVWFILAGGATFAAWPMLYAVSFSSFYFAMLLVLFALILRPVAFKYRSKMPATLWRSLWDWILCGSAVIASILFGAAIGNVLEGIPFHFDNDLRVFYTGSFWQLLNPFALLCGVLSLCMLISQGAHYLACKTTSPLQTRAIFSARLFALLSIILFIIGGLFIKYSVHGYHIISTVNGNGPSNPLYKQVSSATGDWLMNYTQFPWMLSAPILALLGFILSLLLAKFSKLALVFNSLAITGIITTVGFSMFPFLLPSSSMPNASLTVWDSSSSHVTLFLMLVVTVFFMPIILAYTTWVYRVLRGKITENDITNNESAY